AVADQDAQAARRKVVSRVARETVRHRRQAEGALGAAPARTLQRQARGDGLVDLRELVRLLAAAVDARAQEHAEIGRQLLLEVQRNARARAPAAHARDLGDAAGLCREIDGVLVLGHARVVQEAEQLERARSFEQGVALLELADERDLAEALV